MGKDISKGGTSFFQSNLHIAASINCQQNKLRENKPRFLKSAATTQLLTLRCCLRPVLQFTIESYLHPRRRRRRKKRTGIQPPPIVARRNHSPHRKEKQPKPWKLFNRGNPRARTQCPRHKYPNAKRSQTVRPSGTLQVAKRNKNTHTIAFERYTRRTHPNPQPPLYPNLPTSPSLTPELPLPLKSLRISIKTSRQFPLTPPTLK